MTKALGLIETRGLIASIEAADAMVKAADVTLVNQERVDAALVTILIEGDVSAVQAAVDAGSEAAKRVGKLISSHVIANPDNYTHNLIKKSVKKEQSEKKRIPEADKKVSAVQPVVEIDTEDVVKDSTAAKKNSKTAKSTKKAKPDAKPAASKTNKTENKNTKK